MKNFLIFSIIIIVLFYFIRGIDNPQPSRSLKGLPFNTPAYSDRLPPDQRLLNINKSNAPTVQNKSIPHDNILEEQRIKVPEIYPIEQATQFFIPPEQRSPGNLGGPPPLPQ